VRPAAGDPVDVVAVRGDASDVVRFVDILDDIGVQAVETQRAKASLDEELKDIAELRGLVEDDVAGALSPEESDELAARLRAFEARAGEPVIEPVIEPADDAPADNAPPAAREGDGPDHAAIDARLEAAQARLKAETRDVGEREQAIVERADRLGAAVGEADDRSVVRLALETAQRIAAERSRAIVAQTDRLEPADVDALASA